MSARVRGEFSDAPGGVMSEKRAAGLSVLRRARGAQKFKAQICALKRESANLQLERASMSYKTNYRTLTRGPFRIHLQTTRPACVLVYATVRAL